MVWHWSPETLVPLDAALVRREEPVDDTLAREDVPIIQKISFGGEITVTETAARRDYKGRLFWAHAGDLIYSRIRAKQGSLAIVPPEISTLAVSNEYPVFAVRPDRAERDYLALLLRSKAFAYFLDGVSHGSSTKTRVLPEAFEALTVPLPPLTTQRAIVAAWNEVKTEVSATRARADAIEAKARAAFLAGLGLEEPSALAPRKAFSLDFARIDRWGVAQMRESIYAPDPASGRYPVVQLRDVVADLENGWSPKCHPRPARADEWGVLKLGAVSFGSYDESENKALPVELNPVPSLEVKEGDVLISRANVPRYVGACVFVEATRPQLMLCDKIFRVVPRPNGTLNLRFFAEIMKTPHLRRQIENSTTGASPTMQNISKPSLLALRFPLPPLPVQQQLVDAMQAARREATRLRVEADSRETAATTELEAALLGTSPQA